jgi:hypothetical protein
MRFKILILAFLLQGCTKDDFAWNRLRYPEIGNLTVLENNLSYIHAQAQCFSAGNSKNTIRGFCWSENEFPTINDNVVLSEGSGIGNFNAFIDWNYSADQKRYIRGFCQNEIGVSYSTIIEITNPVTNMNLPSVSTASSINNLYSAGAELQGEIISNGGIPLLEYGICFSTNNTNPDTSDLVQSINGDIQNSFSITLSNLQSTTQYYYRAFARNSIGVSYGQVYSFSTGNDYTIGSTGPGGGLIFYKKPTPTDNWQYLEAAPSDVGTYQWAIGAVASYTTDVTNTAIGDGLENTNTIESLLTINAPAAHNAFVYNYGSKTDWYLPSLEETQLLYNNLHTINLGGFVNSASYWTSTEDENFSTNAWYVKFNPSNPYIQTIDKSTAFRVRAIRRF